MEGYTLLEYIESDGTQYIDTGFKSVSFVMKLDIQFFKRTNRSLMGFSEEAACYFGINTEGYYELGGGNVSTFSGLQRREISLESTSSGMSLTAGDSVISRSRTEAVNTSFLLFGAPSTSGLASYPCSARLYSCKIYVGESLVRDYVPCMDNNGVYGLYDKVNEVFYTSATDYGFTGKWAENKTLNVSMSEYRHRMLNLIPKTGLPKGYFRCEYIESDGTNFIDTGFAPNNNTRVTCDFEFMKTPTSAHACIFGSRISSSSAMYEFFWHYSNAYFRSDYNKTATNTWSTNAVGRFVVDKDKETTTFSGESKSYTNTSFSSSYNLYLFALNQAGTAQWYATARIYSCQIYDNGVKVRDYVPCVSPEGYFGLYDLVTDEFYGFVQQKTERSYTVNTTRVGSWEKEEGVNPDSSKYDGMYYSDESHGVDSGYDIMRITIKGYDEFTCYIRSYGESSFDYTVIGDLDTELTYSMSGGSVGVKAHTQVNQNGGTDINSYTKVVYTGIGGGTHFIDVMYRKDGSVNAEDDRGYLLIDKTTVSSGKTIQVIGRGKVILPGGYTNAEYIAGNGNAWFDVGFAPNQDTRVVCDFSFSSEGQIAIFGGRTAYQSSDFSFWRNSGNTFLSNYNSSSHSSSVTSTGRFTVDKDKNVTKINGDEYSSSYGTFQSPYSLYLFNVNSKNTADTRVGPLYMFYCAVFDNGEFVRLFVPCKYDGVFGMYDMIEGIFYSSEGISEFTGESDGDNEVLPEGVFIEDTTGKLWDIDKWDGSATFNSVAVIGDTHSFGISGSHIGACDFSPCTLSDDGVFYGVDYGLTGYDSVDLAYEDMDGEGNTNIIISSQGTGNTYAAQKCRSHNFPNGKSGYLMAAGEYKMICDNITEINKALEKVGGKKVDINVSSSSIVGMWTSTYCPMTPYVTAENTYMGYYMEFYQVRATYAEGIQLVSFVHPTVDGPYNGVSDSFNGKFTASVSGYINGMSRVSSNIGCRPLCSLKK